jgi:hypothetical protein
MHIDSELHADWKNDFGRGLGLLRKPAMELFDNHIATSSSFNEAPEMIKR